MVTGHRCVADVCLLVSHFWLLFGSFCIFGFVVSFSLVVVLSMLCYVLLSI